MIDEAPLRRPGVVTLLTAALGQSADLVQTEIRLARAEVSEKLTALRLGLVMMAAGAIVLIAALGLLLQAAVGALIAAGLAPAVALLLVGGAAGVVGLILFLTGQKRLEPASLAPDRTIDSLSADSRMVKETLS